MPTSSFKLTSLIITAALASGIIACTPEEKPAPEPETRPAIELTDPGQAVIMIPAGSLEPVSVAFSTESAIEDLAIENVKEADWCTAEFEGTDHIRITPNQLRLGETASAEFAVTDPGNEYIEPVTLLVTRGGATILEIRPVEFLKEEDREVRFNAGPQDPYIISLKANFPIEDLVLEGESDWCTAEFEGNDKIKVTSSEKDRFEEKTATFTIRGKESLTRAATIKVPGTLSFKVTRSACLTEKMTTVTFVQEGSTFWLNPGQTGTEYLYGTFNFPLENITVKNVGGTDWCTVKAVEKGIEITTTRVEENADLEAKFEISSSENLDLGHVIYEPDPQTIKLIKTKKPVEPTLKLSGEGLTWSPEGGYYLYQGDPNGGTIRITVSTNQPKWYYTDPYMTEWLTASPQEGKDGDVLTLTYPANTSGEQIMAYPNVEYEKYSYQGAMMIIMIPAL